MTKFPEGSGKGPRVGSEARRGELPVVPVASAKEEGPDNLLADPPFAAAEGPDGSGTSSSHSHPYPSRSDAGGSAPAGPPRCCEQAYLRGFDAGYQEGLKRGVEMAAEVAAEELEERFDV